MSDILALRPNNYPSLSGSFSRISAMSRNRRQGLFNSRRRNVSRPIRLMSRLARGRTRTLTRTQTKARNHGGVLGGDNADRKFIYQHKRMPRRKRKRWVRFVKRVEAVDERDLGSRTVLFNDSISQTGPGIVGPTQNTLTLALYPFQSTTAGWLDDMSIIQGYENTLAPTPALGDMVLPSSKYLFLSAVLDITIRNTSVINGETTQTLVPEASIELDIYEMVARKNTSTRTVLNTTLSTAFNSYDDPEIGGAGLGYDINSRGATPFEFGGQMGRYGLKVLKKTKFFIPNGQTITWQYRDPSRHTIRRDQLTENDGLNRPGWTRFFFIVYKLVPGLTQGGTPGTYRASINCGITRKYRYKIEGLKEDRERLVGTAYIPGASA